MMIALKKYGLFLYWTLLLLDCWFVNINEPFFRYATKPLLVPLLFWYLWVHASKKHQHLHKYFYYLALLFAWLADLLLLNNSKGIFFSLGCTFLALMYATYGVFYAALKSFNRAAGGLFFAALLLVGINVLFYRYVQLQLGIHQWQVIALMCIVSFSLLAAINVLFSSVKKRLALKYFVPGTALLALSTMVLATNIFIVNETFLDVVVAVCYGYGQILIADGVKKIVQV